MWFWWFMLFCNMLTPLVMLLAGRFMWKHPPKDINWAIGYRTRRSMRNEDTWRFAHEHCGRLWWKMGWILLLPSLLAQICVYGAGEETVEILGVALMTLQILCLIASIFPTEMALKRAFTDEGIRKS